MKRILSKKWITTILVLMVAVLTLTACNTPAPDPYAPTPTPTPVKLSGEIIIDGSSTVFPITEAVAEEFRKTNSGVNISIGFSGTGGGFKKFTIGETDISNASRPIKESEATIAKDNKIDYVELMIAYDGLSIMVNKANDFVTSLTMAELKLIWAPESTVKTWRDVRPEWPNEPIKLYAPGTDSGTFDYFTEVVNGKSGAIRTDFTPSEDDNVLVQGIAGDKYSLGFFGYAYYVENTDKLKIVKIDAGKGAIEPTFETIKDGSYAPLSRPIFMYVTKTALAKAHVMAFVKYFLTDGTSLIKEVGYVPLGDAKYTEELAKLK
jgi:phosphate transport system substrate-binding protein